MFSRELHMLPTIDSSGANAGTSNARSNTTTSANTDRGRTRGIGSTTGIGNATGTGTSIDTGTGTGFSIHFPNADGAAVSVGSTTADFQNDRFGPRRRMMVSSAGAGPGPAAGSSSAQGDNAIYAHAHARPTPRGPPLRLGSEDELHTGSTTSSARYGTGMTNSGKMTDINDGNDGEILIRDGSGGYEVEALLAKLEMEQKGRGKGGAGGGGGAGGAEGEEADDEAEDGDEDDSEEESGEEEEVIDTKIIEAWKMGDAKARQKIDQTELKAALHATLLKRVSELDRDRWMFEVEEESEGSV